MLIFKGENGLGFIDTGFISMKVSNSFHHFKRETMRHDIDVELL